MQEKNLNRLQQYIHQNPIIVGVFIFAQLIFIILIVFAIRSVNTNTFEISNLSVFDLTKEIEGLPESSIDPIQTVIYDTVTMNGGTLTSIKDSDAKIREGTVRNIYFDKQNIHYVNFIIDIPSIEQSYQVFHEWTNDYSNQYYLINRATMVMCPLKDQAEYLNFDCHDKYNHNGQAFIASQFLPYFDLNGFKIFLQYDKAPYTIIVAPKTFGVDDSTKAFYIQQTKEKVASLGFPPDAFNYYASYGPEDPELFLEYIISNQ